MNEKKNLSKKETFDLAVQNHQKNNLDVAENLYKKILEKDPNDFQSICFLGTLSIRKCFWFAIMFWRLEKILGIFYETPNRNYY